MADNPGKAVLLTRPLAQSQAYGAALRSEFGQAFWLEIAPLMALEAVTAEVDLTGVSALAFTSPHAVQEFARIATERHLPAFCVGDATAIAATSHGFRATSAAGTGDDLIRLLLRHKGTILHPSGREMSVDIARSLAEHGREARNLALYRQKPLPITRSARNLLTSETDVVLPLFSKRSAEYFVAESKDCEARSLSFVAISPKVGAVLSPLNRPIRIADAPDADAVTREIAAWLDLAP